MSVKSQAKRQAEAERGEYVDGGVMGDSSRRKSSLCLFSAHLPLEMDSKKIGKAQLGKHHRMLRPGESD